MSLARICEKEATMAPVASGPEIVKGSNEQNATLFCGVARDLISEFSRIASVWGMAIALKQFGLF